MFEVILNLGDGEQLVAKCKVPKTSVVNAFMSQMSKDLAKAQELIYNETVINKDEIEPLFEKYPFAKVSLINKILERLGLTNDVIVREVEEQKN
jgi:hypothetical protein